MYADMRLLLLVVTVAVVGAIFFDGMKRRKNVDTHDSDLDDIHNNTAGNKKIDPDMDDDPNAHWAIQEDPWMPQVTVKKATPIEGIMVINVIAKSPLGFSGKALLSVMTDNKLEYSAKKTYDFYEPDTGELLYSIASIVEPGTFDNQKITQKNYPGVMLFMIIALVDDPALAFEQMLKTAQDIAQKLNADLCDIEYQPLLEEHIEQLRLRVQDRTMA